MSSSAEPAGGGRVSWVASRSERGATSGAWARGGRGAGRWDFQVLAGPKGSVARAGGEADGLGGRWVVGSQTAPVDGAGWSSALASRSWGRWPSAASHATDAGITWLRDHAGPMDALASVGRREDGRTTARLLVRHRDVEAGWSKAGAQERVLAAYAGALSAAPLRVEVTAGGRARSVRAGLGGGAESAGAVGQWSTDGSARSWRVRGGTRLQSAVGAASSFEMETSREGERSKTLLFVSASAPRGAMVLRLDGRMPSDAASLWRGEARAPLDRGVLVLAADVVRSRLNACDVRVDIVGARLALHIPARGATAGSLAVAPVTGRARAFRGVVAWRRGSAVSFQAEWTVGR